MPYNNFSYVIDSSFQPFSMQEMLVPFAMYKDEFEKSEEAYNDLTNKSDEFKYLSETLPEGSKARELYEGYANDLRAQADDFAQNGLNMGNRRALTNLKRRYQGEIGRLSKADEALRQERELRRKLGAQDSSILYADDNLTIDSFLDNATPNLYSISGNELYTRGAAAGKAASSRIYSAGDEGSTLNGYYRKWVERNGYSKESMDAFRANAAAIPELQQAANAILAERGVTENLTGNNLERARQSVLNGIIDGAIYQERINPVRDEGVMSAAARAQLEDNRDARALSAAMYGYKKVNGKWVRDSNTTPVKGSRSSGSVSNSGRGGNSTNRYAQLSRGVRIKWDDDPTAKDATYTSTDLDSSPSTEVEHQGRAITYDELPQYAKDRVDAELGPDGNVDLHRYYFSPYVSGDFNDDEAVLEIFPYDVTVYNGEDVSIEDDADLKGGK